MMHYFQIYEAVSIREDIKCIIFFFYMMISTGKTFILERIIFRCENNLGKFQEEGTQY